MLTLSFLPFRNVFRQARGLISHYQDGKGVKQIININKPLFLLLKSPLDNINIETVVQSI